MIVSLDTTVIIAVSLAAGVALLLARVAAIERRLNRLSRVDAKLDALLKHSVITFDEYASVPPDVADAIRRGETIVAIKRFRRVTGLGLKEAKDFVDEVRLRGAGT
jgi:ribosomal protein L7/L12